MDVEYNKKLWRFWAEVLVDESGDSAAEKMVTDIHLNELFNGEIWMDINVGGNIYMMPETALRNFVSKCNELFEQKDKPKRR